MKSQFLSLLPHTCRSLCVENSIFNCSSRSKKNTKHTDSKLEQELGGTELTLPQRNRQLAQLHMHACIQSGARRHGEIHKCES
jgi:truncated hemoglobin YjbI